MHTKYVCPHGKVISQCRCIGPKTEMIVECPFDSHKERESNEIKEL